MPAEAALAERGEPRIVIVGGGFGGLEAAKVLGKAGLEVTLVDRQNHHLFQPLLYQVATAALSAADIAEPIRKILRRHRNARVILGEVARVDADKRSLTLTDGMVLPYDVLILAPGAAHSYFGHDEWAGFAPGLKTVEDARAIRSRSLLAFEHAEKTDDPAEQQRLMTIAVVGGGPTGVELAGSLAELSRFTLARDFRQVDPEKARIILLEAGPRLLSGFSEKMSRYAAERLERLGVEVKTGAAVEEIGEDFVRFSGEAVPTGVVVWAAGVAASPLGRTLGVETDRTGRVPVDEKLAVRGLPDVYAIGDLARCEDEEGNPLPGLAQVAKQQGRHLATQLARHLREGAPMSPFRYRGRGNTAIVGRHAAIFEQGSFKIKGWLAWLAWAFIHVYLLVGAQHRTQVSLQWLWRYVTYERGARLLTHPDGAPKAGKGPLPQAADEPARRPDRTVR